MSTDHDEPMELVMPFIVCQSKGGPYDDDAFVAGFQAGQIEKALQAANVGDADRVRFSTFTALVPQVELIGMRHGFPVMVAESSEEWPGWCMLTFLREAEPS